MSQAFLLASSAYGLEFDPDSGELRLLYAWQPWAGDSPQKALLLDGVVSAKFSQDDTGIWLEVCEPDECASRFVP